MSEGTVSHVATHTLKYEYMLPVVCVPSAVPAFGSLTAYTVFPICIRTDRPVQTV